MTIFGESAGGMSVALLMLSPPASGLYHNVIMQSGTAVSLYSALERRRADVRARSVNNLGRVGVGDEDWGEEVKGRDGYREYDSVE